jgi:hypothetical protein
MFNFCGFVVLWTSVLISCHIIPKKITPIFFRPCSRIIVSEVHKTTKPQNEEMKLMVKLPSNPLYNIILLYNAIFNPKNR